MAVNTSIQNKVLLKKLPIILKKDAKNMKIHDLFKEFVLYEGVSSEIHAGEPLKVTVVNVQNTLTKSCRTTAKYFDSQQLVFEKNSDSIVKAIGQRNYDILISALSSIWSQDLKIQGILSLLTLPKKTSTVTLQTEGSDTMKKVKMYIETACQTDETRLEVVKVRRKRVRRHQLAPYVVTESPPLKKVVIYPSEFNKICIEKVESVKTESDNDIRPMKELPDVKRFIDEDSNFSEISFGNISLSTSLIPSNVDDPVSLLNNLEQNVIEKCHSGPLTNITLLDGTIVSLPVKPEDHFHVATSDNMRGLSVENRRKLLWHQAYLDFKHCMDKTEDNLLPIHVAVMNNEVNLLRRLCLVITSKNESVDTPADTHLTALQMSIHCNHPRCTELLLQYNADPLATDSEQRSILHLCATKSIDCLKIVIKHCKEHARSILRGNEDLWKEHLEKKTDNYVSSYLLQKMCSIYDDQGYTPLMLASHLGIADCVRVLAEAAPGTVNLQMPNTGNTALYIAVTSAGIDAAGRGNKSKASENFMKTIDTLIKHDANPTIDNYAGSNVTVLLTNEFNMAELSRLIACKHTTDKYFDGIPNSIDYQHLMYVKDKDGQLKKEQINRVNVKGSKQKGVVKHFKSDSKVKNDALLTKIVTKNPVANGKTGKPIILQNIPIKTSVVPLRLTNVIQPQTLAMKNVARTQPRLV